MKRNEEKLGKFGKRIVKKDIAESLGGLNKNLSQESTLKVLQILWRAVSWRLSKWIVQSFLILDVRSCISADDGR